ENKGDNNFSFAGSVIPDPHIDLIEADKDLTADYPLDSEYIQLIHLKIRLLEDLHLEKFEKLISICLRQNLIDTMAPLKYLKNKEKIEELDFYDNRINHISKHINEFPNLKILDLSFNKIKHIKNLKNLENLENLYLVQNKIETIENLEKLIKLTSLELGGNKIKKISENLNYLTNLQELWLGKNRIYELENLDNLRNLKILSIQANRITKLKNLSKLINLEELYISNNGIETLEGLENCEKLTIIDITSNKIKKLSCLSHLINLTDLWCSYNYISDFKNVEQELQKLPNLECVYFEHNPLQTDNPTSYRRKLKIIIPQLKKIDATF
ncbi:hypothetical protein PACTADRAFT_20400, partial [Pachysolen tannophilus NRRL Y-2460]